MSKTAEIVKKDEVLKGRIALAIIIYYFQIFIDSLSKSSLLEGSKKVCEIFIKGFFHSEDFSACCGSIGISSSVLESFLDKLKSRAISGDTESSDPELENLSLIIFKKQLEKALGPTVRPNMKVNLERFIADFVKEGRSMGFEADEITDFLVEIFHELGYIDVAIPDPKPRFRFPLPIPNQVS